MSEFSEENVSSNEDLKRDAAISGASDDQTCDQGIVSARGTEEGLVLRIDGKAEWSNILSEIDDFLGGKRRFFAGGEVNIEWLEQLPTKDQSSELESFLKDNFGMKIATRKKKLSRFLRSAGGSLETADKNDSKRVQYENPPGFEEEGTDAPVESLLERVERIAAGESVDGDYGSSYSNENVLGSQAEQYSSIDSPREGGDKFVERITEILGAELLADEEANCRIIFGTLRSGQRVETPFSLIVVGDVNPGADIIAGGDIFVLGSLRGTAHAGAYDDDTVERLIMALQMQPMQLRIGSVVSRGVAEAGTSPEVARIDSRTIIVEPYSARACGARGSRLSGGFGSGVRR